MDLRCPVDGHQLQRSYVEERPVGSCRHCHGLWISGLARFETALPVDQIPAESRRARGRTPAAGARVCPWCENAMVAETHSGITIEMCPHCGSAWLDAGEFDAVRAVLLKAGKLPPAMAGSSTSDWWILFNDPTGLLQLIAALLDGV